MRPAVRPCAAGFAPQAVALALAVALGLQLLRAFFSLANFVLVAARGFDPLAAAALALASLGAGFLAPPVARAVGAARAAAAAAFGLALVRVAEQVVRDPGADLALAAVGTGLFFVYLALAAGGGAAAAGALLAGVAGDAALHTALGTLDLSWQRGEAPLLLVVPAALLLAAAALAAARVPDGPAPAGVGSAPPAGFWFLGPWLFLELVVFQNPAALAARGWPLPAAGLAVAAGNGIGLLAWARLARRGGAGRREAAGLGTVLLAGIAGWAFGGAAALAGVALGQAAAASLVPALVAPEAGVSRHRTSLAAGGAPLLLLVFLFLYYGAFEYPLGLPGPSLPLLAGVLVAGVGLARLPRRRRAASPAALPWTAAALLLLPPFGLWLTAVRPASPAARPPTAVRVMTYNVHQGFDTTGRLDPTALAGVIAAAGAEVVALQEVARGWLPAGAVDLLGELSRHLRMVPRFAPTAGAQWGNALLSRYPLRRFDVRPLPPASLPLRRGYFDAEIDVGGVGLRLLGTHFHHPQGGEEIRELQARALLAAWGGTPATLLLGDLNAVPESAVIRRFRDAGLHDAGALLSPGERSTVRNQGRERQIDYLWATPDLSFAAVEVPFSTASDHLPVVATVLLPPAGAEGPAAAAAPRRAPGTAGNAAHEEPPGRP